METFFKQLKQRQIFKVATIYIVSAWPLVTIADVLFPALGLPDSVLVLLIKVFFVGFPICLIFAWLINFTPEGVEKADGKQSHQSTGIDRSRINLRAFATVGGALVVAFGLTLGSQLMFNNPATERQQTETAPQALALGSPSELDSIAVMPFEVFSGDVQDEYFVDGMVEELLNLLAGVPELSVAARTSSFAYKGVKDKTISQIGQELGVDTILEGSIRKNDVANRIRVTAQLVDVNSGAQLFSEVFDREYRDIFQIQDELAHLVTDKMKSTLLGNAEKMEFVAGTENVDAMIEYGKGQKELARRTAMSIQAALGHFQQAVELDPKYARAHVGISDANILLALYGNLLAEEAFAKAQKSLDTAMQINPRLGAAYASQGLLYSELRKNAEAETAFKKAIELNPNYAMAYMWYGSLVKSRGDVGGAHELHKKAVELDPKSAIAAYNVAWGHYELGDEAAAMEWFSKILANDPFYPGAYALVGDILTTRGRLDEAADMYQRAISVDPHNRMAISNILAVTMDLQDFDATDRWLNYIDQNQEVFTHDEIVQLRARYYASKGEIELGLQELRKMDFSRGPKYVSDFMRGELAYFEGDFQNAVDHYEAARGETDDSVYLFLNLADGQSAAHLAYAYYQIGRTEEAERLIFDMEANFNRLQERNFIDPDVYYNMALTRVMLGRNEEAYEYLQAAVDSGWVQIWQQEIEHILNEFKQQERFKLVAGGIQARLAIMRGRLNNPESKSLASIQVN